MKTRKVVRRPSRLDSRLCVATMDLQSAWKSTTTSLEPAAWSSASNSLAEATSFTIVASWMERSVKSETEGSMEADKEKVRGQVREARARARQDDADVGGFRCTVLCSALWLVWPGQARSQLCTGGGARCDARAKVPLFASGRTLLLAKALKRRTGPTSVQR